MQVIESLTSRVLYALIRSRFNFVSEWAEEKIAERTPLCIDLDAGVIEISVDGGVIEIPLDPMQEMELKGFMAQIDASLFAAKPDLSEPVVSLSDWRQWRENGNESDYSDDGSDDF